MTIKEIIMEHLKENGYDGLYCDECCCDIGILMCCSDVFDAGPNAECKPGYYCKCNPETCTADGDCTFHIGEINYERK